jgi:hypothetical protein
MNMHEKLPASLSKLQQKYELNANKIYKHEISIFSSLKLKLEKIMPHDLLIISTNALSTPPSKHGRYIPDITEKELTHSLSLSNPNFVDLKTLESPDDNPTIPNMINATAPPGFYDLIRSPFISSFQIEHSRFTPLHRLIPNKFIDNDYELVDIYGEDGENSYTDSLNTKAGEMLVEDLLGVNAMKAKCYKYWFKYA